MKTTFISSKAIFEATRLSLMKMQSKLVDAQQEVASGRLADVGASLGLKAGQTVSLRREHARLETIIDSNAIVATRLEATQAALQGIRDGAQSFLGALVAGRSGDTGPKVGQRQAEGGLASLTDALNAALDGAHLFSGINADVKPLANYYQSPPAANRQAVADAFLAAFGVSQSDPGVEAIGAADMQAFLDTTFAGLFAEPAWSSTWSAASDQNIKCRISTYELIEASTNANEEAVRKLAAAYTMVADLGVEKLNQGAFQAVVDTALRLSGEAIQGLTLLQANLGAAQERVSNANARMSIQIDIMTNHINLLEAVDPYEASTRVTSLLTQIETAYALTARIQRLSLLNYL